MKRGRLSKLRIEYQGTQSLLANASSYRDGSDINSFSKVNQFVDLNPALEENKVQVLNLLKYGSDNEVFCSGGHVADRAEIRKWVLSKLRYESELRRVSERREAKILVADATSSAAKVQSNATSAK